MKFPDSYSGLVALLCLFIGGNVHAQTPTVHKTENVILITLDGVRWQEVFTRADSTLLLDRTYSPDTAGAKKLYWAATTDANGSCLFAGIPSQPRASCTATD